jgi:SAM-dependent methyltransferase
VKESDIRPGDLFQRYLELCSTDAVTYFGSSQRKDIPCPACKSSSSQAVFEKWGFGYVLCQSCGTLYQSPRPANEDFALFYQESPSARYWARTFFPAVTEARRKHLFRPKVTEISKLCKKDGLIPHVVADVGAGYGLFLEEWHKRFPETDLIAIEPNPDLAEVCRSKNFSVAKCFAEQALYLHGQIDLVVAFEVIEHVHNPLDFCISLRHLLRNGGRALLTAPTVDGFDIQVLWQDSKTVSPPHHINLMSVAGFEKLLTHSGFSSMHIYTPGRLDVDIVKNILNEKPHILAGHRFLTHLLKQDERVLKSFQRFLSEHQLSSHCWIWAEK